MRISTRTSTKDAARGRWHGILTELGIDPHYLRDKHGPCPLCGGKDRFRFDNKNGDGTYFCSGCGAGDGMKLAVEWAGGQFKDVAAKIDGMIGNIEFDTVKPKPKSNPMKVLSKSRPAGLLVEPYLKSRGLELPQYLGECPSHDYWETDENGDLVKHGSFPCMVASLRDESGQVLGSHITFLDGNRKASVTSAKKINGEAPNGAVARLYDITPTLGIAEGIETAIACKILFGVNTWAALNTAFMEKFTPPEGVRNVIVFADNDENYAGHKAAFTLAHKLKIKGYGVKVKFPPRAGMDFNDVLLEQ
ncbi:MAG: toprim domain-containing protein [Rickettsiales bacterium]